MKIGELDLEALERLTEPDLDNKTGFNVFRTVHNFNARQTASLERRQQINPENLGYKVALLGIYQFKYWKEKKAEERAKLVDLLCWFIENYPTYSLTSHASINDYDISDFRKIKRAWLKQVRLNPENSKVVYSAAYFCREQDINAAEKLLLQGKHLDDSCLWSFALLELYVKRLGNPRMKKSALEKALQEWPELVARLERGGKVYPAFTSLATILKMQKRINEEL